MKFTLAKIRKAARELLTLDEKDTRRLFEGELACETNSIDISNPIAIEIGYFNLVGKWHITTCVVHNCHYYDDASIIS